MELHLMLFLCVAIWSFAGKEVAGKGPLVYFKATLSKTSHYGVGSTIRFGRVKANIGRGYNPSSGVFVVPVSGYYQFTAILQSTSGGHSNFALVARGSPKAWVTVSNIWDSTTLSAIIHVNRGNQVFIRKTWDTGNAPLRHGPWSQFTGYLLRKD